MCCNNKCLFFIKVRIGSIIFGNIAAAISGFGVLACTGLILYYATSAIMGSHNVIAEANPGLSLSMIFFTKFTAAFTCTVLLLFGITQNKPVLVKTYIIYGMIQLVLLLAIAVILFCTCVTIFGFLALIGCCIYTLIIYMVYLAYTEMINHENGKVLTNRQNLMA